MRHGPPPIIRVIVILVLLALGAYWFFFLREAEADGRLAASGTIEAYEVTVSAEMGGRVVEVLAQVGEPVTAGQPLVRFDTALLEAQLAQAQAGLAAAQASYDLLAAGPSAGQLAAAQAGVARAEAGLNAVNDQLVAASEQVEATAGQIELLTEQAAEVTAAMIAARQQLESLPANRPTDEREAAQDALAQAQDALAGVNAQLALAQQAQAAATAQVNLLNSQVSVAEATLDSAQAQLELLQEGARPEQLAAAQAQVEAAQAAVGLMETQIGRQTLTAPLDGVVLARAVEPGEVAAPGAALLILGRLDELTITVFVPEDRYGRIRLGQEAAITVDSFPGETFTGTVGRIADQAEFTPRNVQTAEGRASTVFAIELSVANDNGKLKPGMPADVDFGE
ncbi:MAG: efflux RND transporter periplasmic adaptor subunit [Chloroflexi bacterium]|nr:efflux RND transporter periplasmic adaptor subunit [Chloroflexota bacterium]MCI0578135.1 efflux RND transporter periplasmic adaptor subunit [Chloroflexota bacterium]MCI0649627.1 efflux RND transporter periplasmic adaptor subunit [Chloroflexota bacterium]MCI0727912.1 efflux RND transporter periplasmic adaptor subunit [Chloroflexota bacterium]